MIGYIFGGLFTGLPFVLGLIVLIFPPKNMDSDVYGFHTKTTTSDRETWDYAQKIGGKTLIIFSAAGIVLFISAMVIFQTIFDEYFFIRIIIGFVLLLVTAIGAFVVTDFKTRKFYYKKLREKENPK